MALFPGPSTFPGPTTYPGAPAAYRFLTPTTPVRFRIIGSLWGSFDVGLNVRRDPDGVWHTEIYTDADDLAVATAFYAGGYEHPITDTERDDLVAGGFEDRITSLES